MRWRKLDWIWVVINLVVIFETVKFWSFRVHWFIKLSLVQWRMLLSRFSNQCLTLNESYFPTLAMFLLTRLVRIREKRKGTQKRDIISKREKGKVNLCYCRKRMRLQPSIFYFPLHILHLCRNSWIINQVCLYIYIYWMFCIEAICGVSAWSPTTSIPRGDEGDGEGTSSQSRQAVKDKECIFRHLLFYR